MAAIGYQADQEVIAESAAVNDLLLSLEQAIGDAGEMLHRYEARVCAELEEALPGLSQERYLELALRSDRFGLRTALDTLRRCGDRLGQI